MDNMTELKYLKLPVLVHASVQLDGEEDQHAKGEEMKGVQFHLQGHFFKQ